MIFINSFFTRKTVAIFLLLQITSLASKAQEDTVSKKLQWYVSAGLNTNFPFKIVIDPSVHPAQRSFLSYYDGKIALGGAISTELKIKIYKNFNIETGLMFIMRSSNYSTDTARLREYQTFMYPNYYADITDYYYFPVSVEIPVIFLFSKNKWEFGVGSNIRAYTFSYCKYTYLDKHINYNFDRYIGLQSLYPVVRTSYTMNKHKISIYGYYRNTRGIDVLLTYSFEIYKK